LLPAAGATRVLLLLASALAAGSLVLTRRLQKGYVNALAESLRAGTVRLDPVDVVDQTTRATLAVADAQKRRVGGEPAKESPSADAGGEPWLDAAAILHSGDPGRIRGVLTREAVLEPELVSLVVPLLA